MNKPKNANSSRDVAPSVAALVGLLVLVLSAAASPAFSHRLQDVELNSGRSQTALLLTFSRQAGEGEYPLYFQIADPSRGTLTLSFLDTETDFPLGRHAVESSNPLVEEVLLKRVTSPSGKNFLGIEVRLKEPPTGEAPVQPMPRGAMKVILGKGGSKASWSLSKSMATRDDYLTAKAEPEHAPPAPAIPTAPAPPPEPVSPAVPSDGVEAAPVPTMLREIRMAVTRSQEDVTLVFEPGGATPVHTAQANAKDSAILEITLDGVTSGLGRKEIVLPRSGLFRKARLAQRGGDRRGGGSLVVSFHRLSGDPVHILPREGALTLTGSGKGEAATPFKWSSLDPDAPLPALADGAPDPVQSAHEDGAALDEGAGGPGRGKGLSSSKVFSLGKGGKGMILHKDSAALRESPSTKAKRGAKVPLGAKVDRLGREGQWLKVSYGADSGYIRADQAVYVDEMTQAQASALEKALASQAEAAAAATAAAAREEAARKAERLAAEKAAQESAASAAAAAQSAAAEPVRVAGPGMAAPSPKGAPADKAVDMPAEGGPKLNMGGNPELADREAREKRAAEEERMRLEAKERRIAYNSYGRRDPFIPVEQGMAENGIDIDQMKVVGIIWQAQEPLAVLEHNRESGVSFTVKQGDPVHNGRVSRITRDQVTFDISEYGISRSYSLKLVSNKEGIKK